MKVVMTLDIPDALLEKEGVSKDEVFAQFESLGDELIETAPEGTKITVRIEQ